MKKRSFGKKPVIIVITAIVLVLVLGFFALGSRRAGFIENAVGTVFAPVQSFASRISGSISNFFRNAFNTTDADIENARLKSELALRNSALAELEELRLENERLRGLLNYAGSIGGLEGVTARVIGRSTSVYSNVFTVNVGRSSGVDVDMPVISSDGLVGTVSEVGASWCKITTITDPTMSVPIMVERTRDGCMARGMMSTGGSAASLELYYLPADSSDLIPGDIIITSGTGGIYPKGLRVGTVTEVMTSSRSSVNALITPSADLVRLEEVLIITGQGGEG